jgi:hypothetical protein
VVAYLNEGHTGHEAAAKFGLTYNQVSYMREKAKGTYDKKPKVIRRAKTKMQVIPEAPASTEKVFVIVTTAGDLSSVLRGLQ